MEQLEFSEDEIKKQLAALGYFDVSEVRMKQFQKDLHKLIEHDRSASGSSSWFTGVSSPSSNSDFSDTQDKKRETRRPIPSRFQPHVKCPERYNNDSTESSSKADSSWMAQSDVGHLAVHRHRDRSPNSTKRTSSSWKPTADYGLSSSLADAEARNESVTRPKETFMGHQLNLPECDLSTENSDVDSEVHSLAESSKQSKVVRRRKVLRKEIDGTPRVYDESLVEDASRGLYRIHDVSVDDSDPRLTRASHRHHLPPRPHSARPEWKKDSDFEAFVGPTQPPSYIRPNTSHPHTRNLKKTDPVNRYHQYKDFWTNIKAPGEKSHNGLRWGVKAQMMYKEELAPKPQRVYVPNTYVVPTTKKRSALRWEVRHAMEHGLPIPTTFDIY